MRSAILTNPAELMKRFRCMPDGTVEITDLNGDVQLIDGYEGKCVCAVIEELNGRCKALMRALEQANA